MPRLTTLFDLQDRMSRKLKTITGDFKKLKKESDKPILIRATDRASKTIGAIDRSVHRLASRSYKVTVRSVDMASKTIGTVKNSLSSLPAMVTIGLSIVGLDKLKDATLGAAMTFETYQVSMNHWLKGNQKAVKESLSWLNQFAAKTPMTMEELFPAFTRAIGLSSGDLSQVKTLVSLATDMASLTPGKTVEDAMEALADAQMGEFERMKEFSMKVTQDSYKAMGGWAGFLKKAQQRFAGGAKALSQTSIGMISTIQDNIQTLFRSSGQGILESIKPRLRTIVTWLDQNQDKWNEWRDTIQNAGRQGSEWLLSKMQNAFMFIRSRYLENDDFKKLDFEGKIKFILGDINKWWDDEGKPALSGWWDKTGKTWAEKIGVSMGKAIFSGIVAGAKEGIPAIGGIWKDAFKSPSIGSFGGAAISTLLAGSLASMLLSPILKGMKGAWGLGKSGKGIISKWITPKNEKIPVPTKTRDSYSQAMFDLKTKKSIQDIGKTAKTSENKIVSLITKIKNLFKLKPPSNFLGGLFGGLSKLPKNATKGAAKGLLRRVPLLGTALSLFDIVTAKGKSGKLKAAGSAGGSALGGLLGSFLGPVGTIGGAALGGYLGGKAMGLFGGGGDSKSHASASPAGTTMPKINMQDYLVKNVYQPLNQAVGNARSYGQAFARTFILGMGTIKISNWNVTALYQPLNQAISNARLYGQAFGKTFMIGLNETPVSLSGWNISALYQPLNQAVGNARLFGRAFSQSFMIGVNEVPVSLSGWNISALYQPLNQAVGNARLFGQAFGKSFMLGVNSAQIGMYAWISNQIYTPLGQAAFYAKTYGMALVFNFKEGIKSIPVGMSVWLRNHVQTPFLNFVPKAYSWGSGLVGYFITGMDSRKGNVSSAARSLARAVENAFRDEMGIHSPSRKMAELGYWSAMGVVKGFSDVDIKKFIEANIASISGAYGGKLSGNVSNWLAMALMATGTSLSWLPGLLKLVQAESGGNPLARNPIPVGGEHATGLLQTLPSTFRAYMQPGMGNILNPIHNAAAAIRYIKSRYGSVYNTPLFRGGRYVGYEKGGIINRQHFAMVGERNKEEAIIPLEQHRNRALGLLSYAANKLGVQSVQPQTQTLPSETVQVASGASSARPSVRGTIRDIIIQITGDNHYSNDMDAEKVAKVAYNYIKRKLEEEYFEGGAMAIYE